MKTLASSPYSAPAGSYFPFDKVFKAFFNPFEKGNLKGADALILWGGTDIHPSFYGETPHQKNQSPMHLSMRDHLEWHLIHEAVENNIPIIGVCRGAQFLCAAAGGKLIQHCTGHEAGHMIKTHDGLSMFANANHHQMMFVEGTEHKLLAWKENKFLSNTYQTFDGKPYDLKGWDVDPEVVWFPKIRALAIQPHPEWHYPNNPGHADFTDWVVKTVEEYCFN